jgi:predicted MFS family arabinose efflux permease
MTQASGSFTTYHKFVILLMALLQFTVVLDFMILSPLGDILMKSLNISTAQFGSVVSAYAISACISGFLAAGFADKFDRKKLLLFFYTGFILGTLMCGLAHSFVSLFIARIVAGIFGGVISSISMAIITDVFNITQRGKVMGFVQMSFAGSQILGVPLGLFLADVFNWNAAFYMVVILCIIVGALALRLKPLNAHLELQKNNAILHLWNTIKRRDYRIGFFAIALLSMGGFMLMPFTSAFLVNNVGISQSQLPVIFFLTGIASIAIMPIIGKLSDRYSKFLLFTIGTIVASIMIVIYTNMSPLPVWQVAIINVILFMGIMSRMVPATALNSAMPDAADRGAYMSVSSSLQQLAGGIASIFAGLVVVQKTKTSPIENFDTLGYVMVALLLVCLYLVFRVARIVKAKTRYL